MNESIECIKSAYAWLGANTGKRYRTELTTGALVHFPTRRNRDAELTVSLTRRQLLSLLAGAGHDGVASIRNDHARPWIPVNNVVWLPLWQRRETA